VLLGWHQLSIIVWRAIDVVGRNQHKRATMEIKSTKSNIVDLPFSLEEQLSSFLTILVFSRLFVSDV